MRAMLLVVVLAAGCAAPPRDLPPPMSPEQQAAVDQDRRDTAHALELLAVERSRPGDVPARLRQIAELNLGPAGGRSSAERRARAERIAAEEARIRSTMERERPVSPSPAAMRDQQARAICEARGRLREGALPYRGVLNLDNIIAGQQAGGICWETYQRTGIMPSY